MLKKEVYVTRKEDVETIDIPLKLFQESKAYITWTDYRMIHNGVEPDDQGNGTNVICLSFIFNPILLREIYYP